VLHSALAKTPLSSRIVLLAVVFVLSGAQPSALGGIGDTSSYEFLAGQSTVVQTGGFAGVDETYVVQGQFRLTANANAGMASFSAVDARLLNPTGFLPTQDLGKLFNMTELQGTVVNDTLIEFRGIAAHGTNTGIALKLQFTNNTVRLTGQTSPPPGSADFFVFSLDAVAQKKYGGGTRDLHNTNLIFESDILNAIGTNLPTHTAMDIPAIHTFSAWGFEDGIDGGSEDTWWLFGEKDYPGLWWDFLGL